ncbi:MAG: cyclic nucleotide-binding domain-containing protein [Candidatus Sulfotelmatobacter sp.]
MSTQLTPLAADIRGEAFPVLSQAQINRIRPLAKIRKVSAGEILFEPGDSDVFFMLLSGSMQIVQPELRGESPIVNLAAGEFTGEITMISDRRCLVRGRVTAAGEFLEKNEQPGSAGPGCPRCGTERDLHARFHPAPCRTD